MKKFILGFSIFGTVLLYVFFNTRAVGLCGEICNPVFGDYQNILLFFPLIFLFSLLTYFLPTRVFTAWWGFAKYAIPVILVLSFIINAGLHHDPAGQWQDIFDLPMLFILYGVFAIGSLVQIIRGFRRR